MDGKMPVIGITPAFDYNAKRLYLKEGYFNAVEQAGGIAVILSFTRDERKIDEYLEMCDGIILTGGPDIDPKYFGEPDMPFNGDISPCRDQMELAVAEKAIECGKPLLGICRGIQIMNVAVGGSVYQDIYSQIKDRELIKHSQNAPEWYPTHEIEIVRGSHISGIFSGKERLFVNSLHHQALKDVPEVFEVTSKTCDGIIESIEHRDHPFAVGVQWHPELMWKEDREYLKIFEELIKEALYNK